MKRRPTFPHGPIPHAPVHNVRRDPVGGFPDDMLLGQIRRHAEAGERVRVNRIGFRSFDIARNGSAFIVLSSLGGRPVGTFGNIAAAVLAGDRYVEAVRRGEFDAEDEDGGDWPRGAA